MSVNPEIYTGFKWMMENPIPAIIIAVVLIGLFQLIMPEKQAYRQRELMKLKMKIKRW